MSRFLLSPEARRDIQQIWAFIADDNVDAATRVRHQIRDACLRLAQRPHMGHKRDDLTSREDILFWPVYAYLIIYRPATRPLEILRVLHGRRNVKGMLR